MKKRPINFNTAYAKLFFSYLAITCAITFLLGIAFFYFYSVKYNQKVIEVNDKIIEQEKNIIEDSYIKKVTSIYVNLASENINSNFTDFKYFFNNPLSGNNVKLYCDYTYMKDVVRNNSDIIDAIHLYIPKNNLLVSTTWGVKFLNESTADETDTIGWFQYTNSPPQKGLWLDTRPMQNAYDWSNLSNGTTYIRSFPLLSNSVPQPGLIAFDLNEENFKNILSQAHTADNEMNLIINQSGNIISSSDSSLLYAGLDDVPYVKNILSMEKSSGSFATKIGQEEYMVSFMNMDTVNWKIISMMPISEYYKQTSLINQVTLLLCAVTLSIGFILTCIFSKNMYNPLKSLLLHIHDLFGEDKKSTARLLKNENEYLVINNALGKLSGKIDELTQNIVEYRPIVKQNMILSLLNNSIPQKEDLGELQKLSGVTFFYPYYNCILLHSNKFNAESSDLKNNLYATYITISHIEAMSNTEASLHAVMLSQSLIGVIINAKSGQNDLVTDLVEKLLFHMITQYDICFTCSMGLWTKDPLTLCDSYHEAQKAMRYKFYYPNEMLLLYESFSSRQKGGVPAEEPSAEDFMSTLNLHNYEKVTSYLDTFISLLLNGGYTSDLCDKKLVQLIDVWMEFCSMHDLGIQMDHQKIAHEFAGLGNITEYHDWILSHVKQAFCLLDEKKALKNLELIEKAKKYINENLGCQLSLDSAAQYVSFTPKYFSKLFKEATGINFQEYVTKQRLEKAKELLFSTNLTAEQISAEIGYSSPAYFIKQFKKAYGDTPRYFRTNCKNGRPCLDTAIEKSNTLSSI